VDDLRRRVLTALGHLRQATRRRTAAEEVLAHLRPLGVDDRAALEAKFKTMRCEIHGETPRLVQTDAGWTLEICCEDLKRRVQGMPI
jgi:hypothetical protein